MSHAVSARHMEAEAEAEVGAGAETRGDCFATARPQAGALAAGSGAGHPGRADLCRSPMLPVAVPLLVLFAHLSVCSPLYALPK